MRPVRLRSVQLRCALRGRARLIQWPGPGGSRMADIVLGFAASHGPTMNTPPDKWLELGQKDVQDVRYDYTSLRPKDGIEKELDPELMAERYAAVHRAIDKLRDRMFAAKPDVIVVFSNPHG